MVTAAAIREHYDSLAFIYRTFWGDHIHHGLFAEGVDTVEEAQLRMLDRCFALVNAGSATSALDVGCGHGGTAVRLARVFGCEVLGITISSKQAHIARESAYKAHVEKLTNFVVDDAEMFPFAAAEFDLVWAMESTEHFSDKAAFINRAASALKPGGRFLIAAWTGSMQHARVREVAQAFLCPELWTAEQYRHAIVAAGLSVRACEDLTRYVTRTWEICRQRVHAAGVALKLLPKSVREFVGGIDVILDAYLSGSLTYTVLVATKQLESP